MIGESVPPSNREMITPLLKKSLEKQGRNHERSAYVKINFVL